MLIIGVLLSVVALVALVISFSPKVPAQARRLSMVGFVFCVLLAVGVFASGGPSVSQNKLGVGAPEDNTAAEKSPLVSQDPNWEYSTNTDQMTGLITKMACTTSTNELNFDFPYDGGSKGEICFRRKAKSLTVTLMVTKGQFDCGIDNCRISLKFDDGAVQPYTGVESATHETGLLFLEPEARLLSSVNHAKKLKVQAAYYQEGRQVLLFDLAGLDTKQL